MQAPCHWQRSSRYDKQALPLADRHYNRQKIGTPQFVPPGRCMVLLGRDAGALWVTSWPFARYTKHAWAGAWINSCFRNESRSVLSSDLIRDAVAITRTFARTEPTWSVEPEPALGMVTFVDADKTKHKRDPGRCYRKAGFKHVGFTKGGLWAFQLLPADMPEPRSMSDLFEVPVSLSPRLAWLQRHALHLRKLENGKHEVSLNEETFARGDDADEACIAFCETTGLRHWNQP